MRAEAATLYCAKHQERNQIVLASNLQAPDFDPPELRELGAASIGRRIA